ncbi:BnaC04g49430D [Brassica napus]|uniref:BnaC04g49430D protein n=1 Tax=Brassica napus TaxID=3708 RepID=A0A078GAF0_BRANA|nr:BnaC04g49430D [Brassica napus]
MYQTSLIETGLIKIKDNYKNRIVFLSHDHSNVGQCGAMQSSSFVFLFFIQQCCSSSISQFLHRFCRCSTEQNIGGRDERKDAPHGHELNDRKLHATRQWRRQFIVRLINPCNIYVDSNNDPGKYFASSATATRYDAHRNNHQQHRDEPQKGAKLVRAAGTNAKILKEPSSGKYLIKLPSGDTRWITSSCRATIGEVSNLSHGVKKKLRKAGESRWLGDKTKRKSKSSGSRGRTSVTPWGKPCKGGYKSASVKKKMKRLAAREAKMM